MAILGLDIGTTGAKAVVFDAAGKLLGAAYKEYSLKSPMPGHLELDPLEVRAAVLEVISGAAAAAQRDPIRSLAMSMLGEAAVPVDASGEPLGSAILCFDNRGEQEAEEFRSRMTAAEVFAITGHGINSYHTLFKILWRKRHEPEIFRRARRFLCMEDFALGALGLPPRINHSLAARTLAFDIHARQWSKPILSAAGLPDLFAPPSAPGEPLGTISSGSFGLPKGCVVAGGLHDQPAGILGAGVRPGESMLATGTTVCLGVRLAAKPSPGPMVENNLCYYPTFGAGYISIAWNFTGGSLLKWFRDQLGQAERDAAERRGVDPYEVMLEGLPQEPTRLLVLPHFTTTGTPWLDPKALGMIMGLRLTTTRKEIVKALVEGIAYEVKLNAELLGKSGVGIGLYKAIGGAAKSPAWMQIYADVLERPVAVLSVTEGAALGAALMGARAAGIITSDAEAEDVAARLAKVERIYEPRESHVRAYRERFAIYREIYPATRSLTHRLSAL